MTEEWKDIKSDDFVGLKKNRFIVIGKVKHINKKTHSIKYKCCCECGNIFYRRKEDIEKLSMVAVLIVKESEPIY